MDIPYQDQKLTYTDDGRLLDQEGRSVMMEWERPIMEYQAKVISGPGKDVLNVGFGMGIVDTYIQSHGPNTHTIIELHPDVYFHMLSEGWLKKPGVIPLFGDWRAYLEHLPRYDGIYIDTWNEEFDDFLRYAPNLLKEGGVLTFFNNIVNEDNESKIYPPYQQVCQELYDVEMVEFEIPTVGSIEEQSNDGYFYWNPEFKTYYCPILRAK